MAEQNRAPLPHDFHPQVHAFSVESVDLEPGADLGDAQVLRGGNVSPQLRWEGFPEGTKSFAVTCFDPDAPTGSGFWHWVLFDLPASVTELAGRGGEREVRRAARRGRARAERLRHEGLRRGCSAYWERHRYVFTVYAVDQEKLGPGADVSCGGRRIQPAVPLVGSGAADR